MPRLPPQGPLGEHQGISVLSRLSTLRWNCLVCIMKHSSALLLRTLGCPRKRLDVAETLWLPLIPLLVIRPSGSGWNRETVVWIYEGCKSSNKCKNSNISFSACSPCVLWAFSEWYLEWSLSDLSIMSEWFLSVIPDCALSVRWFEVKSFWFQYFWSYWTIFTIWWLGFIFCMMCCFSKKEHPPPQTGTAPFTLPSLDRVSLRFGNLDWVSSKLFAPSKTWAAAPSMCSNRFKYGNYSEILTIVVIANICRGLLEYLWLTISTSLSSNRVTLWSKIATEMS